MCQFTPESWWQILLWTMACSRTGRVATIVSPSRTVFQLYAGVSFMVAWLIIIWLPVVEGPRSLLVHEIVSSSLMA